MQRTWSIYEVLALHDGASKDARLHHALDQLRPELDASRVRGEWQPIGAMDRRSFARFVLEHPDSKIDTPAVLVWTRPEIALLALRPHEPVPDSPAAAFPARTACSLLLRVEVPRAEREGRVHSGIVDESSDDVAREADAKISLAIGIVKAEVAITKVLREAPFHPGLSGMEYQSRGREAEAALHTALRCTTPAWPYDRLTGWAKLYNAMYMLYGAYGSGAPKTPFFYALERADSEYAQLRLRNLEARLKHRRLCTDVISEAAAA